MVVVEGDTETTTTRRRRRRRRRWWWWWRRAGVLAGRGAGLLPGCPIGVQYCRSLYVWLMVVVARRCASNTHA
eukprot:scaffold640_cov178-Prasinococcus_capsulatus_cf.AAC.2